MDWSRVKAEWSWIKPRPGGNEVRRRNSFYSFMSASSFILVLVMIIMGFTCHIYTKVFFWIDLTE